MLSFHWNTFGLHRKIRKNQVRGYISVSLLGQSKTGTILQDGWLQIRIFQD